ncbi:hypothetical protein Tco_0524544 [Tanacetum coccineum]
MTATGLAHCPVATSATAATRVPPSTAHQCVTVTLADQAAFTLANQVAVTSTDHFGLGGNQSSQARWKIGVPKYLYQCISRVQNNSGNEAPRLDVKLLSQRDFVGEALGLDGKLLSQNNSTNVTPGLDSKLLFQNNSTNEALRLDDKLPSQDNISHRKMYHAALIELRLGDHAFLKRETGLPLAVDGASNLPLPEVGNTVYGIYLCAIASK